MTNEYPNVSILIPCRNESDCITQVLTDVVSLDYPQDKLEVIVADGQSDDGTVAKINDFISTHPNVQLIDNPHKTVPFALNLAIKQAKGEWIVRMDAHSNYPQDYLKQLISWAQKLDADNVGGVWKIVTKENTLMAKGIASATAHPFGAGDASYKIGAKEPKEVDTVPFGCYHRSVFDEGFLFDEELTRNQDDELNARIKKHRKKIYIIPDIEIIYYPRTKLAKMALMYYQYGYYKPLVNKKISQITTLRQLAPPLFVLFLILSLFTGIFTGSIYLALAVIFPHSILNLIASFKICVEKRNLLLLPYLYTIFLTIHSSYGYGYLRGIVDFILRPKRSVKQVGLSR